jgi:hypothetical protein
VEAEVAIYVRLAKTFYWASRAPLLFIVYDMAPVVPTTSAQLVMCVMVLVLAPTVGGIKHGVQYRFPTSTIVLCSTVFL